MEEFIRELLNKMGQVDLAGTGADVPTPTEEPGEGEHVVGVLPESLQRFNIVISNMAGELHKQCVSDHKLADKLMASPFSEISTEERAALIRHANMHQRQDLLTDIFWQGVREAFPEATAGAGSICVRKGWQVTVARSQSPLIELASLASLAELLGGGPGRGRRRG